MLTRRSLLLTTGTLAAGSLLAGCNTTAGPTLSIQLLRGSIPPQLPGEFRKVNPQAAVDFVLQAQLADLFEQLQRWTPQPTNQPPSGMGALLPWGNTSRPTAVADLVTLGDSWLAPAIQQGLIQPIALEDLPQWNALDTRWRDLVRRNERGEVAADGQIWAAPYRFGEVAIAYRRDLFQPLGWVPTDWADLWRPELQHRFSLPDSPRTAIGIALKKLGQSVNSADLDSIANLPQTLATLQAQVKFYSSDAYLQPLSLDDTWLAVGWSTDLVAMAERDPRIATVVPASGSLLFADLWVRPSRATANFDLTKQWIDFCWQPAVATRLSLLSDAASPVLVQGDRTQLPPRLRTQPLLLPDLDLLERSEFLLPVSETTLRQYVRLWETMRRAEAVPPSRG